MKHIMQLRTNDYTT